MSTMGQWRQPTLLAGMVVASCFAASNRGHGRENARDLPTPIDLVEPGLVIGQSAPAEWSHLVVKSHPRIRDEDLSKVGGTTARLSSILFTAFLADVKSAAGGSTYRLERLAVGIGTNIDGKDTILSPDTQKKYGAKLGMLGRQVLSRTYERQKENVVMFRTPVSAIVDAPVVMRRRQHNRFVNFRYLLLVDSNSGRLDVLLWLVDRNEAGDVLGAVGDIEYLPPNKIVDATLAVDDSQFTFGVPSDLAFGVTSLPAGRQKIAMPEDLRAIAGQARLSDAEAKTLERRLRDLLRAETSRAN